MLLAIGAALVIATATPAAPATYADDVYPIGTVEPSCKGGVSFSPKGTMTRLLGCMFQAFAATDPQSPTFAADLRQKWITKVGMARVQGASDELLGKWAQQPSSGMFTRADFAPVRFENMTMKNLENGNFTFDGDLLAQEGSGLVRRSLSGEYALFRGSWTMIRFDIGEPK